MIPIRMLLLPLAAIAMAAAPGPLIIESEVRPTLPGESIPPTDEVAMKRDDGDRMTVAVSVGGQGPFRFLVDTGSERTVISRQLADRLKLEPGKAANLHSIIGLNEVSTVFIPHLSVSSNTVSVVDAPALEEVNIGADGMLGIDSLHSQRVIFDFRANTMAITSAKRRPERLDGDTVVVRARSRKGRLIFTDAKVGGQQVTVIVDTGSQVTIANMALKRRLLRRHQQIRPEPMKIISVTGETMVVAVTELDGVQLGGIRLDSLAVAFTDAHVFKQLDLQDRPAILLGMNAMRAFDRISIDFAEKKVRFVLPGTSMRDPIRFASK